MAMTPDQVDAQNRFNLQNFNAEINLFIRRQNIAAELARSGALGLTRGVQFEYDALLQPARNALTDQMIAGDINTTNLELQQIAIATADPLALAAIVGRNANNDTHVAANNNTTIADLRTIEGRTADAAALNSIARHGNVDAPLLTRIAQNANTNAATLNHIVAQGNTHDALVAVHANTRLADLRLIANRPTTNQHILTAILTNPTHGADPGLMQLVANRRNVLQPQPVVPPVQTPAPQQQPQPVLLQHVTRASIKSGSTPTQPPVQQKPPVVQTPPPPQQPPAQTPKPQPPVTRGSIKKR